MSASVAALEWARAQLRASSGFVGVSVEAALAPADISPPMAILQVDGERPVNTTGARELRAEAELRVTIICQTLKAAAALEKAAKSALVREEGRRNPVSVGGYRVLAAVRLRSSQTPMSEAGRPLACLVVLFRVRMQEE
jgi:hypothetical protein